MQVCLVDPGVGGHLVHGGPPGDVRLQHVSAGTHTDTDTDTDTANVSSSRRTAPNILTSLSLL